MLRPHRALQYARQVKCERRGKFRGIVYGTPLLKVPHNEPQNPDGSTNTLRDATFQNAMQEIVQGNTSHRIAIDSSGRLTKVSDDESIVKHQTALVLSRAHSSLTTYDFHRLHRAEKTASMRGRWLYSSLLPTIACSFENFP
jgi:hypothetical protein